jgi:hypothetical protein
MLSKRSLIVGLVGVNLMLLAALILTAFPPPAAYAQAPGRAGDFVMTSCMVHTDFDVLFVIDRPGSMLHCFTPVPNQPGKVQYVTSRNLLRDFNRLTP